MLRGENELMRTEIYQVSDRYQWKLILAARDSGLADAVTRFRKASHELREVAAQAFEFKPETRLGIAAQALALIGASEAQDDRVGSKFASSLALNLIELDNRLAPDELAVIANPRAPLGQQQRASFASAGGRRSDALAGQRICWRASVCLAARCGNVPALLVLPVCLNRKRSVSCHKEQ